MYHGDIRLGDTIDIKFTSRTFTTGAPGTLSSSPVISAYPGNSTTEVTGGITLSVDFDGRTGLNNCRVVATSGNGYATATNYTLVITTGTVGGVSVVGECIGSFSIECRSALMPATAARTLVVDASGLADANTVKVGPTGSGTAQTARDIGADVGAIKAKTDNLPASPAAVSDIPSAASNAAAVLAATVEGSITVVKMLRGFGSALLGKASGLATTTAVYRNASDSKDVITATVDSDGDRSAVTLDLT
jgi:hypothetical protein